jgi:predicted nucleic acid-binding protein
MIKNHRIFLDTSVVFAAVLSEAGGARKLFRFAEIELIQLVVGPNVLRECETVVRRKAPESLPVFAYLLELSQVEIAREPAEEAIEQANSILEYQPDVYVLAEAIGAAPDWFVTHDKEHFLTIKKNSKFGFLVGTPGDLIQALEEEFTQI